MRTAVTIAAIVLWCLIEAVPIEGQTPAPDGWVVLSVDEYRALRDRSLGAAPPIPAPPVDATLTRVDYELRAEGESITGRALLTVDVMRDGWARVPIPAGLMVRDARVDGQPVAIVEAGRPHLLLPRAGRVMVALELVVPLTSTAGTEAMTLPPSAAPITRLAFVLPRRGVDLAVSNGFVAERAEEPDESRWTVIGRPNQPLALSWKPRIDDRRATLPVRIRARVSQFVGLAEDAGQVSASVRVEVVQGAAQDVAVALAPGVVVNQVDGATVADWQAADGMLRVRLLEATLSEAAFVVQAELRASRDGTITVPILRVPDAERESGGVAVDVLGAGEISGREARGLEPADPSELGDVIAARESPSMIAFRLRPLTGRDVRSLAVTVVRYTPQAVLVANVEEARYHLLAAEDGRLLVKADYAIRNNQRSFLKVSLPRGASVWSAEVGGQPIRPGVAGNDAILLPLDKGRIGQDAPTFVVELVYLQRVAAWANKGPVVIDLPALDLPVSRTGLRVFYPPHFTVALEPGTFRTESDPGPVAEALRRSQPVPASASTDRLQNASGVQTLIDQFRSETGSERRVVGTLPVAVAVPDFGPSIFLAAELTAETQAPSIALAVKRTRD
jgi:hypothetical protein